MLLYSHDGTGLGHLRITLGVASALARRRPEDAIVLLTGSLQVAAYGLPANLDFVKMPAVPKHDLWRDTPLPPIGPLPYAPAMAARAEIALATVRAFAPDLVVVDHAPAGLFREFAPSLEWLRRERPGTRFALLMRDITFGRDQTRQIWQNDGAYPLLAGFYDRILVYGDQQLFDPVAEYDLPPDAAARTRFCGYLTPPPPGRSPAQVRAELGADAGLLAVVTVGGGADGGPVLDAYVRGLDRHAPPGLRSYVVVGPLLPDDERAALEAFVADRPDVVVAPFDPDLIGALRAADVVVSMAGYNAMSEAAFLGKRAVVVPRLPGPEEQVLRAERFRDRGLVTVVPPAELSPDRLWDAILAELASVVSPAPSLTFGGEECIVDELERLAHG